jgi:hypothetical protein
MSFYHLNVVIAYLGMPTYLSRTKLRLSSKSATIGAMIYSTVTFGVTLYGIIINERNYTELSNCHFDKSVGFVKSYTIMTEFLGVLFALGTSGVEYMTQQMTDAQLCRRDMIAAKINVLLYWPVVIGISEAFRASYSSFMLSGEATWSFGQIFAFTMLLAPLFELFSNATAISNENPSMNRFLYWWTIKAGGVKGNELYKRNCLNSGVPKYFVNQLASAFEIYSSRVNNSTEPRRGKGEG